MQSQAGSPENVQAGPPALSERHSTSDVFTEERCFVKEQGAVLFALHNDLFQHQKSVHQAFSALDQACRSLAASVATSQPPDRNNAPRTSLTVESNSTSDAHAPAIPANPPNVRGFTELLRQVEAFHHFLFVNLYVHQRESALQLLAGVERAVLVAAVNERSRDHSTAPRDDAAYEELQCQAAQLRFRLLSTPHVALESRMDVSIEASPRTSTAALPDHAPPRSRGVDVVESSSLSANSTSHAVTAASSDFTDSSPTQASMGGPAPRASGSRKPQRLFAVSAAFAAAGTGGQQSLLSVLSAAQRRFRVHGIVLARTGSHVTSRWGAEAEAEAEGEVQLALQLRCLCLVVPHACRRLYAAAAPIPIITDRDVLTYDRSRGDARESGEATTFASSSTASPPTTAPPIFIPTSTAECCSDSEEDFGGAVGEADEGASALEQLFLSLEADMPEHASDPPPWSPAFATHGAPAGDEESPEMVVQRAALRRDGRQPAHRMKRLRHDMTSHTTSSSTTSGSTTAPVQCSQEGMGVSFSRGAEAVAALAQPDVANSQLELESQHIGQTQHGLPQLSSSPANVTSPSAVVHTEAPADAATPPRPVFQISNSVKYLKPQLIEAISQLGGIVDLSSGYSRECLYLIAAEGITERTEKYLGACAAAAYIVPPRYVFDSQRRGYWLSNRVHEYDMSPQRGSAHQPRPPPIFRSWQVVLITCRSAAARGVRAALLAGGCTSATAFVVDLTAETPIHPSARGHILNVTSAVDGVVDGVCPTSVIDPATLGAATHILVECSSVTAQGFFQLPDWVPLCVRDAAYASRIYTLELLYFCLCAHPERIFDDEGLLCDEEALTPACRVEPL